MGPRSVPLWIGDPDWQGFSARDGSAAVAAGLTHRPLPTWSSRRCAGNASWG